MEMALARIIVRNYNKEKIAEEKGETSKPLTDVLIRYSLEKYPTPEALEKALVKAFWKYRKTDEFRKWFKYESPYFATVTKGLLDELFNSTNLPGIEMIQTFVLMLCCPSDRYNVG